MNSDTWCVNAYTNLATDTDGRVKACCISSKHFTNSAGEIGVLYKDSIKDLWDSKFRKDLITALDAGVKHSNCELCWVEEAAGRDSKRIRDNKTYSHVNVKEVTTPIVLDLKLGNLCNIKCRTCGSHSSSQWIKEEYDLQGDKEVTYKTFASMPYFKSMKDSYDADNANFWTDIIDFLPSVVSFDIYGGEPMYIKKHWEILEKCIELGVSKNQRIHYNTNGTIFPDDKIEILNQFKEVSIQLSLDGAQDKLEYIRHPAKWDEVSSNLEKFRQLAQQYPDRYKIEVCLTISAFNIYYIDEIWEHYTNRGVKVYLNLVYWPYHQALTIFPKQVTEAIINKLDAYVPTSKRDEWEVQYPPIKTMLQTSVYKQELFAEFVRTTQVHDEYRGESFEKTFPEMYKLIQGAI